MRVCPLLERLDEMLSVAHEHATQSIKAFVHLPKERSPGSQRDHTELCDRMITATSQRDHSEITAGSRLHLAAHGEITGLSQRDHSEITGRPQGDHGQLRDPGRTGR